MVDRGCLTARSRSRSLLWLLWLLWLLSLVSLPAAAAQVTVQVHGIDGELAANARAFLSIAAKHKEDWSAARIQRLHRRAPGEIRAALKPFGYYGAQVRGRLREDDGHWIASYRVDRGPPTVVTHLELAAHGPGAELPAIQAALAASKLAAGRRLDHRDYKATKAALAAAAYDAGYLDAHFAAATIRIQARTAQAEIELVLETGERYYFGPVHFQQDILAADFVDRYLNFARGQPFSSEQLVALQLALSDSGYFSRVQVRAERDAVLRGPQVKPAPQLPITIITEPRKPRRYTASVGYGTDTGPRLGLGAEFRRLNRSGHRLRVDLRVSRIRQGLAVHYDIPIDDILRDSLSIGGNIAREIIGDVQTEQYVVSLSRSDGWVLGRRRFYIHLEREYFDLGPGGRDATLLFPGVGVTMRSADDLLRPRRGASLVLDVHGGSDALLSDTAFVQTTAEAAAVLPLGSRGRLLGRTRLGLTQAGNFLALPPSQRFYAGGSRSVRGYGYQEISPENAEGEQIGGKYLAEFSVEMEYLFYRQFGAALFFDAGDVTNSRAFHFKRGVGIGFRWLTPVGTLRVDFAHPLDDPDNDFRLHISLGPDL
ncbi:MAG: autotransporter assembly complex protein TamA [Salinisphaera sp.]|nr:autotransporter assembly complex protein TamA [Salinisphaera sp.]